MTHLSIVVLVIILEHDALWDESLNHGSKIDLDLHQRAAAGHFMRWVFEKGLMKNRVYLGVLKKKREK